MSAIDRQIPIWAKEYRLKNLNERTNDLINMASFDLLFGPFTEKDFSEEDPDRKTIWPGFDAACNEIKVALKDMPKKIWMDNWNVCYNKEPNFADEAEYELFTTYEKDDLLRGVVGKDLYEYVKYFR